MYSMWDRQSDDSVQNALGGLFALDEHLELPSSTFMYSICNQAFCITPAQVIQEMEDDHPVWTLAMFVPKSLDSCQDNVFYWSDI